MGITIREMELPEIEIAIQLAARQGWNPGLSDGMAFFKADPEGFLLAEEGDEFAGCVSAVSYSPDYGFIGFYIVKEGFRGTSAGVKLALAALKRLKGKNIALDGVTGKVEKYKNLGFRQSHKNRRYESIGGSYPGNENIVKYNSVFFEELLKYDRQCFPAIRANFLENWFAMPDSRTLLWMENEKIYGYGTIRKCREGYKIGPLFADNPKIATSLYKALSSEALDELVYIDIPDNNPEALMLAKEFDMKEIFTTVRMYSGDFPDISHDKIFGITSPELG
jgi:hypothetical protein